MDIPLRTLGRHEITENGSQVEDQKNKGADHGQLVLTEFPGHQAPLGSIPHPACPFPAKWPDRDRLQNQRIMGTNPGGSLGVELPLR